MTSDRNLQGVLRTWLHEDRHEDATRVLHTVLDGTAASPQHRPRWSVGGILTMNKFVAAGLAVAAVVVIAIIALNLLPGSQPPGGQPSPSVEPSAAPSEAEPSVTAGLPEGPHSLGHVTVTIPAPGWFGDENSGILSKGEAAPPDEAGMIVFTQEEYIVYGDACHWQSTVPETPVTTVDEFVAALSAQGGRTASEPVDITLDGYAGKSIMLEVPDDVDLTQCDPGVGGSWDCDGDPCGYHGGQDSIDVVYVLDVDGVIWAWETFYWTETPPETVAEMEAIVLSASIGE